MNILKKLAITGAAFALSAGVAFAGETTIEVSGNGGGSYTGVWVSEKNATVLKQTNNTENNTSIVSVATTGDNSTSGGDVNSGHADSEIAVLNVSGLNVANLSGCGCPDDDKVTVEVKNNGKYSVAKVGIKSENVLVAKQTNDTENNTYVYSKTDTGGNKTGKGGWWWNKKGDVTTGNATSKVFVGNVSDANFLNL